MLNSCTLKESRTSARDIATLFHLIMNTLYIINSPSQHYRQSWLKVNRLASSGHQSEKTVLCEIFYRE